MKPKITILIATLTRNHLLRWSLESLLRKRRKSVEIIILDDYYQIDTECKSVADEFNCRYIHTGQTKSDNSWRVPGFAFNIGARLAGGKHIVLSSAETYHLGDTVGHMIKKLDKKKIIVTKNVLDDKGEFIKQLSLGNSPNPKVIQKMRKLNSALPFFMSVPRDVFIEIGGYDEDFTGVCWDDNDIVSRLMKYGCQQEIIDIDIVHLFHPRHNYRSPAIKKRWLLNKELFDARRDVITRNEGREWGVIDSSSVEPQPKKEPETEPETELSSEKEPQPESAPIGSSFGYKSGY